MEQRIVLAHDGSINADWVARYALRMAAGLPGRLLQVIHILDGSMARARIEACFAAIAASFWLVGMKMTSGLRPFILPSCAL